MIGKTYGILKVNITEMLKTMMETITMVADGIKVIGMTYNDNIWDLQLNLLGTAKQEVQVTGASKSGNTILPQYLSQNKLANQNEYFTLERLNYKG